MFFDFAYIVIDLLTINLKIIIYIMSRLKLKQINIVQFATKDGCYKHNNKMNNTDQNLRLQLIKASRTTIVQNYFTFINDFYKQEGLCSDGKAHYQK